MDGSNSCPTCHRDLTAADLAIHTLLCAAFSSPPPKPGPNHVLGLVFPQAADSATGSPSPTPAWIKRTSSTDDETSITFQSVDTSPVLATAAPEVIYTERNTVRNRDTASMLEIWTVPPRPEGEGGERAAVNATIAALASDGRPFHRWTGPVLALAMTRATGFMVDPGSYRDVSLEDAADVVDFLLDYENPEHGRRIREALEMLGAERPAEERAAGGGGGDGGALGGKEDGPAGGEEKQDVAFEVM